MATDVGVIPEVVERDGRTYAGVDADSIESALDQTSFGREPEHEPSSQADGHAEPPKPTRGQKRFSQLTSERDKAIERANAVEAELKALKEAKPAATVQPSQTAPQPNQTVAPEPKKEPAKFPILEDFAKEKDPLSAWGQAIAEWASTKSQSEIDARIRTALEADRASRTQAQTHADILERGKAAYPDFEQVVLGSKTDFPPDMLKAIFRLPHSEHVQYALASDPELAERVRQIADPVLFGLEMAKLGSATGRAEPASRPRAVLPTAPPPIKPVGGTSRTATPSLEELAAKPDAFSDYKAARHAAIGGRHR